MDIRACLLEKKGFADSQGNTVFFFDRGLSGENDNTSAKEIWLFLDEGLRCGGTARKIPCTREAIADVLSGCGKTELLNIVLSFVQYDENEKK